MRTTVTLTPDTAAAVAHLRESEGLGLSEAVNQLIHAGLIAPEPETPYVNVAYDLGECRMDLTCIGEVLAYLDEVERGAG